MLIVGGQAVAIASWWVLSRMTLDRIQERMRLFIPFFLTFGTAAAFGWTTLGKAIVEAEPERAPQLQRRFRRALLVTMLGVLVAYGGLAL